MVSKMKEVTDPSVLSQLQSEVTDPAVLKQLNAPQQEQPTALGAIPAGFNTLVPSILGLPSDTLRNIVNLGIAGFGSLANLSGHPELAPSVLPPMPLGSEDIAKRINQGLTAVTGKPQDVFSNPRPDLPLARGLYTGSSILGAGLLSPAAGVREALANVRSMVKPAIGAAGMQAAFPNEPLAPAIGAISAAGLRGLTPKPVVKQEMIRAAKEAGYTIPPVQAKPTIMNRLLEGWAGKINTAQGASIKNVAKTNEKAVADLGLPKGTILSNDILSGLRSQAGDVYKQASNLPPLKADVVYRNKLASISGKTSALTAEFPGLMDKGVNDLVNTFNKGEISAPAAIEAIKKLRADSSVGYRSTDPAVRAKAVAQKDIASALEDLMGRNVKQNMPDFNKDFSAARQLIAKTYTAEKALNDATGNVSTRKLSAELTKGKPLSGGMKQAAQFGQAFPMAAQDIRSSMPGISPLDVAQAGIQTAASGHPGWLATVLGRPMARSMILSAPYQKLMTTPNLPIDQRSLLGAIIQGNK